MPSGACACGCGQETNLHPRTGEPRKFLKGHARRRHPRVDGLKLCRGRCGETKPLDTFPPDGRSADGRGTRCRECKAASARDRYDPHADYKRAIKRKYGVTWDDYDAMLTRFDGCWICGATEPGGGKRYFTVDHCHATSKVRGLLCHDCNVGLGSFKDRVDVMERAVQYLRNQLTEGDTP